MNTEDEPFISVITPVFNGGEFLAACIDSVLGQTYRNFEYIIVNNRSTDDSLEIALSYAKRDKRIRVHTNERFVPVIENHNIAFRLVSRSAKYCKVVSADDLLFPECIEQMVRFGEANPSVGIIGSYQLSGSVIRWQGFQYPKTILPGAEICRRIFLGGEPTFGFGSPTSILYRADLVIGNAEFYPNASPHADTSACFKELKRCDFGFVYQVLSYERTHEQTQSFKSAEMNRYSSAYLNDLLQYGPLYLTDRELEGRVRETLQDYRRFLAVNYMVGFRGEEFWNYHKGRLQELGYPLTRVVLLKAAAKALLEGTAHPVESARKLWRRVGARSAGLRFGAG